MTVLDSNILVYSVDERDERKFAIATSILDTARSDRDEYAIAVQTLAEFTNVAIGKLALPPDEVVDFVKIYSDITTVRPDHDIVVRGVAIMNRYTIQFYDAMMLAAAERAGATEFYTEDLNDGQFYCDIKAVNPFK